MKSTPSVKRRSTYYTAERVSAAGENIRRFAWASDQATEAIMAADLAADESFSHIYDLVTPQTIPRASRVHATAGCPICGDAIHRVGIYPYEYEPGGEPWTIGCPLCKSVFPSNDFASYYQSGLDDRGLFRPDLADRSLLVNTRYPDMPDDWLVDDGYGWTAPLEPVSGLDPSIPPGSKHVFIAHYNHWAVWGFPMGNRPQYGKVFGALVALRDAMIYTGEVRYAETLLVLLFRIATVYPEMDISVYPWSDGYCNSSGGSDKGKIVGRIWETMVSRNLVSAYDALFEHVKGCTRALEFLGSVGEPDDTDSIVDFIETSLVRSVFENVRSGAIRGNKGMHESALGLAAVVLDDPETSTSWLEWLYSPGGEDTSLDIPVTGGNVENVLTDEVDRDGMGNESAPSYNSIWPRDFRILATALSGWDRSGGHDLSRHPVFRKMFSPYEKLIMIDRFLPHIGDSGYCGVPGFGKRGLVNSFYALEVFRSTGDRRQAAFAVHLDEIGVEPMRLDIFEPDQDKTIEAAREIEATDGPYRATGYNMTGYGLAILRPADTWNTWLTYGRTAGHGHSDSLTIGFYGFGIDLSPDLGNPEHKNKYNRTTHEWFHNTVNHNTVVVDETRQRWVYSGIPRAYFDGPEVGIMDAESPGVYEQTSLYRRGIVQISTGNGSYYLVDLFRIHGGESHHLSFHPAEGEITSSTLHTEAAEGTYADAVGSDVTPAGTNEPLVHYAGSGFHHLTRVSIDRDPADTFVAEWKLTDTWGVEESFGDVRLRYHHCSPSTSVAFGDGKPAANKAGTPDHLRYLMIERRASDRAVDGLASQFVSLIETFREAGVIASVERLDCFDFESGEQVDPDRSGVVGLRVGFADGRADIVFSSLDPTRTYRIGDSIVGAGLYGVVRIDSGNVRYALLYQGTLLEYQEHELIAREHRSIRGEVVDFTRERSESNEIIVRTKQDIAGIEPGACLYVENQWERQAQSGSLSRRPFPGHHDRSIGYYDLRTGCFRIEAISKISEGAYRVSVGDVTLIEGFEDPADHSRGYLYAIEPGDPWEIPVVSEYLPLD